MTIFSTPPVTTSASICTSATRLPRVRLRLRLRHHRAVIGLSVPLGSLINGRTRCRFGLITRHNTPMRQPWRSPRLGRGPPLQLSLPLSRDKRICDKGETLGRHIGKETLGGVEWAVGGWRGGGRRRHCDAARR